MPIYSTTTYKGFTILLPDPVGTGGAVVQDAIKKAADFIDSFNLANPTSGDLIQYDMATQKWVRTSALNNLHTTGTLLVQDQITIGKGVIDFDDSTGDGNSSFGLTSGKFVFDANISSDSLGANSVGDGNKFLADNNTWIAASGLSGYSGYSGVGTSGFSGFSGKSGFSGISGFSGFSGTAGTAGTSGFSGISGYSGFSGTTGTSGFSGYSGISGYSGYSGIGGGFTFTYDSSTSAGPASGNVRGSNSPFTGSSTLYISKTDSNGADLSTILAAIKANDTLFFVDVNNPAATLSVVVSSNTDQTGYVTIGTTSHSASGTFTNGDQLSLRILSKGFSGFSGVSGYSGYSGISGYSGYSGISGWSGTSGTSGTSGYSGYSGISGYSGFSGFSSKAFIPFSVQHAKLPTSNAARIDGSEQNWRLLFDPSTSQSAIWQFVVPQSYGSSPKVRLVFSVNSTQSGTNAVIWRVSVMKDTPGTDAEDVNTSGFATANSVTATLASNQTAGYALSALCTISNDDSMIAGDFVQMKIDRDASNVSDTATGDAELIGVLFEYTKTS